MATENVAAALVRLRALRKKVDHSVTLTLELWVHSLGREEAEWAVWDGTEHFTGATIEAALIQAERAWGLAAHPAPPETVEMP